MDDLSPELESELANEIIGSFDFVRTVEVAPHKHPTSQALGLTEIHEGTHRKIVSSTTFGEVQMILAAMAQQKQPSLPWSPRKLLGFTITHSWSAHEGFAVFREIHYGKLFKDWVTGMPIPPKYERAYSKYKRMSDVLPPELMPFELGLVRTIAEIAFNTRILSLISIRDLTPIALFEHLRAPLNRPDVRLELLVDAISNTRISADFAEALLQRFQAAAERFGFERINSIETFMRESLTNAQLPRLQFHEEWDRIETELTLKEIQRLKLDELNIMDPYLAGKQINEYHSEALPYLKTMGIELPIRKVATELELALQRTNVEYVPPTVLDVLFAGDQNDIATAFLKLFADKDVVIDVRRIPNPLQHEIPGEYAYTIYASPLVPLEENILIISDQTSLEGGMIRYVVSGSREFIWEIVQSLRRVTLLVLGQALISQEGWKCVNDVESLSAIVGLEPLTIVQTTAAPYLMELVHQLKELGLRSTLFAGISARVAYFVFGLSSGVHVLVKIPHTLIGVLKVHDQGSFSWFAQVIDSTKADSAGLSTAPFNKLTAAKVVQLEIRGAFYQARQGKVGNINAAWLNASLPSS